MKWIKYPEEKPLNAGEYLILYLDNSAKGSHQWEPAIWSKIHQTFIDCTTPDYWAYVTFNNLPPYTEEHTNPKQPRASKRLACIERKLDEIIKFVLRLDEKEKS